MRALVIEDDESDRIAIAAALETAGFDVAAAADGRAGLTVLRERGADVVVLDLLMPVMDGYGFLEAVHSDPELSGTPIIVVSGADYDARLARTAAYVKKPCRLSELVDRARRWAGFRANA